MLQEIVCCRRLLIARVIAVHAGGSCYKWLFTTIVGTIMQAMLMGSDLVVTPYTPPLK